MKRITWEKLKTYYVVGTVLGIVSCIVMWTAAFMGGGAPLLYYILLIPFSIVMMPIVWAGFLMNIKKILVGIIAPIPLLSFMIEYIKGFIYGIKGLFCLFRHQDLVIGGGNEDE